MHARRRPHAWGAVTCWAGRGCALRECCVPPLDGFRGCALRERSVCHLDGFPRRFSRSTTGVQAWQSIVRYGQDASAAGTHHGQLQS
jgi:hypothetical protein